MPFVNTREEIGERATLDGLIDGTLEELRDNTAVSLSDAKTGLFKNHLGLKTIVLPNFIIGGNQYFSTANVNNDSTSPYIPAAEIIVIKCSNFSSTFGHCGNVRVFDLYRTAGGGIAGYMFKRCYNMDTLIIRNQDIVGLNQTTNVFDYTPFASGGTGGTLYVPSALISSYQSATNWSTILGYANNQILPIEGSIYDGYYADGSPIE